MRVYAYIDAFNFYYGLTRQTPYRWCNLARLCEQVLPDEHFETIKLFTAYSKGFPGNQQAPQRQKTYFRALATLDNVEMITSKFSPSEKFFPLADKLPQIQKVKVCFSKEKGSDVKLASHLLLDGFKDKYDLALVFTNDSDLVLPVQFARYELRKTVGVVLTNRLRDPDRPGCIQLMEAANFYRLVSDEMLAASQFPDVFIDRKGKLIRKPSGW